MAKPALFIKSNALILLSGMILTGSSSLAQELSGNSLMKADQARKTRPALNKKKEQPKTLEKVTAETPIAVEAEKKRKNGVEALASLCADVSSRRQIM